jgi:hypothetical protein
MLGFWSVRPKKVFDFALTTALKPCKAGNHKPVASSERPSNVWIADPPKTKFQPSKPTCDLCVSLNLRKVNLGGPFKIQYLTNGHSSITRVQQPIVQKFSWPLECLITAVLEKTIQNLTSYHIHAHFKFQSWPLTSDISTILPKFALAM